MKNLLLTEDKAIEFLAPESDLEKRFLQDDAFLKGLFWGKPRFGHPEGKVILHIREVLDNVDKLQLSEKDRYYLRIATFVHDTFKYKEDRSTPRDWSKHHSILARQFLEQYTSDALLLNLVELHDEAYYIWQLFQLKRNPSQGQKRLDLLREKMNGGMQLYYLFFKCDTSTGDKTLAPLKWFENTISGIELVQL